MIELTRDIKLPRNLPVPRANGLTGDIKLAKAKDDAVVGVEIDAGSVGVVEVDAATGAVSQAAVGALPAGSFRDGEVADPDSIAAALRALYSAHDFSRRVRLGIANPRVVVRTLRLPAIEDPAELDTAIRFETQEQIPMPLDQAVLEHRVVGGTAATDEAPAQVDVLVVAARRDMIGASLKPLRDAGLEPVGVDLSAFGMIRALGELSVSPGSEPGGQPQPRTILYCSIGDVTNLAISRGRSCLFTRVSPVGIADVVESLAGATQLSSEHARLWLNHVGLAQPPEQIEGDPEVVARVRAALESGAASLLDELRLSIDFYGAQEAAMAIEQVVLCGPGSAIPGLAEKMEPALGMPIAVGRPGALGDYEAMDAARLTLPYGLALER
jgi:type IV pilus assembly protein PilM